MTETSASLGPSPVATALHARRSVRAFTDRQVTPAQLEAILSPALRAPSGGNLQPWHIHVATGPALDRLRLHIQGEMAAGREEQAGHAVYPASLWDPYRTRRFENGEALYQTIAIDRADKPARLAQLAKNFQLFGAPVGLFFAIDRRMGASQWMDLGILMQSVMLAATDLGLATCPQAAWANWPESLSTLLGVPDEMVVVAGMALGYEDVDHPINTLRTPRQSFDEAVTIHRD